MQQHGTHRMPVWQMEHNTLLLRLLKQNEDIITLNKELVDQNLSLLRLCEELADMRKKD